MKKVVITIPLYKASLTSEERVSLERCFSVLGSRYTIVFTTPEGLDLSFLGEEYSSTKVVTFDPKYFDGLKGYNQLMTSVEFYGVFLEYEYLLIYQLDCYLFRDELALWCDKGYDYIGAPWLGKRKYRKLLYRPVIKIKNLLQKMKGHFHTNFLYYKVGNGGFSLRRVARFYEILQTEQQSAQQYVERCDESPVYNEDVFWALIAPRKGHRIKRPHWKRAMLFSFEFTQGNGGNFDEKHIPFGCHGWNKAETIDFWRPIITKYGK